MKLLLVDDEVKFVSRLAERLELRGFKADWATTSDEALAKVGTETYDIAVLDIKMPTMSGIALKKRMEEMAPDMKFIFITGHGSERDYDVVCKEAICCIIKPFKIETLVEKIELALNM
ncbi:response regulator [Thermodesulfobacteriota bacterium]